MNWDDLREKGAECLRQKGLEKSLLMDAWIKLDNLIGFVRCRIFAKTKSGVTYFEERKYTVDEIKDIDPEVFKELQKKGYAEKNIMTYIQ